MNFSSLPNYLGYVSAFSLLYSSSGIGFDWLFYYRALIHPFKQLC
jgi:hypothetical protein